MRGSTDVQVIADTSSQLLNDCRSFFYDYQAMWNLCDAEAICNVCSTELQVRWAYPGNNISDWGYHEACEGWRQAFLSYAERGPKWAFHELKVTPINDDEVLVLFWVTFELDGAPTKEANLFVETFRKESNGWKLIRSHVEAAIPRIFAGL